MQACSDLLVFLLLLLLGRTCATVIAQALQEYPLQLEGIGHHLPGALIDGAGGDLAVANHGPR